MRKSVTAYSARWACEVQIFAPLTTQSPSELRSARVVMEDRSEPLSGSLRPIAVKHSPAAIRGKMSKRCISLPKRNKVGPV